MTASNSAEIGTKPDISVRMTYRPGAPRATTIEDPKRKYIGSGDGQATGRHVQGTVKWDLFEQQGETVCDVRLVGVIEDKIGVPITFEAIGHFRRDDSKSSRWELVSDAVFTTGNGAYSRINGVNARWVGSFDAESYEHEYAVFLP